MQTVIEAMHAANLASVQAHGTAILARAAATDPTIVALVFRIEGQALDLEFQDDRGVALGGEGL